MVLVISTLLSSLAIGQQTNILDTLSHGYRTLPSVKGLLVGKLAPVWKLDRDCDFSLGQLL